MLLKTLLQSYLTTGHPAYDPVIPSFTETITGCRVFLDEAPTIYLDDDGAEINVPAAGPDVLIYATGPHQSLPGTDDSVTTVELAIDLTLPPETSPTDAEGHWEGLKKLLRARLIETEPQPHIRHPLADRLTALASYQELDLRIHDILEWQETPAIEELPSGGLQRSLKATYLFSPLPT